jgi:hypothetical protein
MKQSRRVVYIGPEAVFRGLEGRIVQGRDPARPEPRLEFQPDSDAIRPIPCDPEHVRAVEESGAAEALAVEPASE